MYANSQEFANACDVVAAVASPASELKIALAGPPPASNHWQCGTPRLVGEQSRAQVPTAAVRELGNALPNQVEQIEDETGLTNVVIRPNLYEANRSIIRGEPYLCLDYGLSDLDHPARAPAGQRRAAPRAVKDPVPDDAHVDAPRAPAG